MRPALFDAIYMSEEGHIVAIAPKTAMVPLFAALALRPETGVSLPAAADVLVETGESRTPRPKRVSRQSTPGVVDSFSVRSRTPVDWVPKERSHWRSGPRALVR